MNNLSVKTRKRLHHLLLSAIKIQNRLNGYRLSILGDERCQTRKPLIYAITHIGKADIEIASEVIKQHFYLLSRDFEKEVFAFMNRLMPYWENVFLTWGLK